MTAAIKSETELFFEIATELKEARRNRAPRATVDDLSSELMDMWQHTGNEIIRRRCEALLTNLNRIDFHSAAS